MGAIAHVFGFLDRMGGAGGGVFADYSIVAFYGGFDYGGGEGAVGRCHCYFVFWRYNAVFMVAEGSGAMVFRFQEEMGAVSRRALAVLVL